VADWDGRGQSKATLYSHVDTFDNDTEERENIEFRMPYSLLTIRVSMVSVRDSVK